MIEVDVTESDIRVDGGLYAHARPASSGVRVTFESRYGPLVYATDRFDHWRDNVRAIALGLEALRKVDRYGIIRRGSSTPGGSRCPAAPGWRHRT